MELLAEQDPWLVIGLVLGAALPSRAVQVGEVVLLPLDADQLGQAESVRPENVQLSFEDEEGKQVPQVRVSPHHVSVMSSRGFSVAVQDAADYDDAESQALLKLAQARQSLTLAVGQPYIF